MIEGNKGSDDRPVKIGQGHKTLNEYISGHPKPKDEDAYLFYKQKNGSVYDKLSTRPLRDKLAMAHQKASVDFKIYGEPFHIFRKACATFYPVNELATWEEVCKFQGKKVDSTKPTYFKMSMGDVNASVLDSLGIEESDEDLGHRMEGKPLTPMDCPMCDHRNRCYKNICTQCGASLNPEELPDKLETENQEAEKEVSRIDELEQRLADLES